jgi:hypothetical protein
MSQTHEYQLIIETFRDTFGDNFSMSDVAEWSINKGWLKEPPPETPVNRLAKKLAKAARQQTKRDNVTNLSYRVNHAYKVLRNGEQIMLWVDIDRASRDAMDASFTLRRQQMVGDAVQLSHDADHWNRVNSTENPIQIELDFGPDVVWANAAPRENLVGV